ncbi:MAG: hypothetical protein L6R40_001830 [Gallowayella cf. fulva]|nr:MAG: hypothetical protein L6R40_001830 [Xanthomendoza cf. fulva]
MPPDHTQEADGDFGGFGDTTNQHPYNPPSSILIVGAGVFGLSAALAILSSPLYSRTQLTLVDPDIPDTEALSHDQEARYTPSAHTASIDSSRIIRPDYANPAYSRLAAGAQKEWRKGYGGEGVYHESGLVVVSGQTGNEYVEAACRNVEEETDLSTDGQTEERLDVERLKGPEEIRAVSGLPPTSSSSSGGTETEYLGQAGYINRSSGWANAEGAMKTMMQRIFSHRPHINLRRGKAARLLVSHTSQKSKAFVSGIQLTEGSQLNAGLTILATGAWTPSLLDLTGRIQPTAQCLAYLPLTTTEAAALAKMPVTSLSPQPKTLLPHHPPSRPLNQPVHPVLTNTTPITSKSPATPMAISLPLLPPARCLLPL